MRRLLNKLVYLEKKRRRDRAIKAYMSHKGEIPRLSREEEAKAKAIWNVFGLPFNTNWHRYFKHMTGKFDERSVPQDIWNLFEIALNPTEYRDAFQHKVLCYNILPAGTLPYPIAAIVNGVTMDGSLSPCSHEAFVEALCREGRVVVKVATFTGGGKGVRLIDFGSMTKAEVSAFLENTLADRKDYIFQRVLKTSEDFSRFNPLSTNTIRVITLNINGRTTLASSFLRMATDDRINDNAGAGGTMVAVHPDGQLHHFGVDNAMAEKRLSSPTGLIFSELKLECYQKLVDKLISLHEKLPYLGFIAWDATVDEDEEVRVIEMNLDSQELECHQAFNGAIFGERTQEVIDYVLRRKFKRIKVF
ncbi:sugar-transfer associated ATP-grasp domain-containing protein [Porphyromonas sp.]|uniref:sugar-transfer associated ATP-grasp domain-containing protein n=1 Tax=Porphyromonas sp. TaxID=1924944 RepID=UPI0026DA9744|nr:sugar-transfer associated ATP-grasp domain-containing protein [Porphyromonas sp.]MDO4770787.1 sugar-transfer associated ATP-grasp domain-containing protein [Porphyromonas sp.]